MDVTTIKAEWLEKQLKSKNISYFKDYPMKKATTFEIGGITPLLIEIDHENTLSQVIQWVWEKQIPYYILGKGSNVLFPDGYFAGVVLYFAEKYATMKKLDNGKFSADSGASLTKFSSFVGDLGYTGMEFAYGIPGSVGGGVYMNAGAYGGEMKDILVEIKYLDQNGKISVEKRDPQNLSAQDQFSYRHSFLTNTFNIMLNAVISLQKGDMKLIEQTMNKHMTARKEKQPLEYPSAGSVFKRPIKGYASALIDQCGLKGMEVGGAKVSEKHAGFIINQGDATATEVLQLIEKIQEKVFQSTGIPLECELKIATPLVR